MKIWIRTIIYAVVAGLLTTLVLVGQGFVKSKIAETKVKKVMVKQQEVFSKLSDEYTLNEKDISDTSVYNVSGAAECAMPALVSVGVTTVSYSYDFFGREYSYENSGNASGIISAQNYDELLIVTNNHVVEGVTKVNVTFIDGTTVDAAVRSTEESEDLAVISVKLSKIPTETLAKIRIATFGDSDELVPGERVIAIGNALGYGQSVTVGYVSALGREVKMDDFTLKLIQTDVAINPGNSGGALLNSRGEVVGINNVKIASTAVEGVCYAIPVTTALPIIEELMVRVDLPKEEQASLGFKGEVISAESARYYNMPRGIYIKEVKSDSPAEKAGLKTGYIITAINGRPVYSKERFEKIMAYTHGGSEGTVTVKKPVEGEYVEETYNVTFAFRDEF